ncbi:MAG: tautomerase family protein [Albidovulum sp.]
MVREVTDAFVRTAGGTPQSVQIVITEVDQADWAVAGEIVADRSK